MSERPLVGTELKRFLREYSRRNRPDVRIAGLLQSVEYPYNVGAIFRLAEGAGMSELVLSGITPRPPHPTIEKVARYKTGRIPWSYQEDPIDAIHSLKGEGYQVVALELTHSAVPYHRYPFTDSTCLVVGHEDHGVTKATLARCDASLFIPMYGKGLSLNVHTALAIVVYHILQSKDREQ